MNIESVAVFCASQYGNNPLYQQHAGELGKLIAALKLKLIYGGGNVGLMGEIANACLAHGGHIIGVIPKLLIEWEREHKGLTELAVVPDMHARKKMMYDLCDAAIVMPGGFGTLDEFFEMLTWNQLSIHNKRILLLNTAGFFSPLEGYLQKMEDEGFLYNHVEPRISVCDTPEEIIELLHIQ